MYFFVPSIISLPFRLPPKFLGSFVRNRPVRTRNGETHTLDPALTLMTRAGGPRLEDGTPKKARSMYLLARRLFESHPLPMPWFNLSIPTPHGQMMGRIYRPWHLPKVAPCMLYLHGGGWVIGDIETHHCICTWLAEHLSMAVISIEYRLGPEDPMPAGNEDTMTTWQWMVDNAEKMEIDPTQFHVGGDSAGGGLSIWLSHTLRDRKDRGEDVVMPQSQLLIYPGTGLGFEGGSMQDCAEGFGLGVSTIEYFVKHGFGSIEDAQNPEYFPGINGPYHGLPDTFTCVAPFDPLHDGGVEYAKKVSTEGGRSATFCAPNVMHDFIGMKSLPACAHATRQMTERYNAFLQEGQE